jgi:hypothetical protein
MEMAILLALGHHPTAHVRVCGIVLATVLEKRARAEGRENLSKNMCVGEIALPPVSAPVLEENKDRIHCSMGRGRLLLYVAALASRVLKMKVVLPARIAV